MAQNLIEQGYNPDQEFGEGWQDAAGYGAGVGGFVQLVTDLIAPRRFGMGGDFNRVYDREVAKENLKDEEEQKRLAAEEAARQDQETLKKTKAPLDDEKSLDEKINSGEADGFYDANGNYISANDFVSSRDYDGVEEGDVNDASAELTEEAFELAARNAEERVDEKEMELALQLMWDAETFVTIPPELEHLTEAHWAYVETILTCLEIQRSMNRIH